MSTLHPSREEVLAQRGYDKHRDGDDALPVGTRTRTVPYTGTTRIGTGELDADREMFRMRTGTSTAPDWQQRVRIAARARVAEHADLFDWDCTKCETSVMTPDLSDPCPNCLL